jgi:pyridoxal phosphate enzyme (YggS family)
MPPDSGQIQANLAAVRARIEAAARTAGRNARDIRLIAASKYVDTAMLRSALLAGQYCFGESYLQEARSKQAQLDDPRIEWHFIGHLQGNKAKHVPGHFAWLHTLDSLQLAQRLSAAASRVPATLNVLLQVNVADDPDKRGIPPRELFGFVEALLEAGYPALHLRGLMTIGRQQADTNSRQAEFAALHELLQACAARFGREYFTELSMGMSDDFELAIAEGATQVRIGTTIFGPRPAAAPPARPCIP